MGQVAAERAAPVVQILVFGRAFVEFEVGNAGELLVSDRNIEAVAEGEQRFFAHFLLLVGDVLPLARFAHAVAFDGFGEDDGRLAFGFHRHVVGGKDFMRIVAAAVELPDLLIGHISDQLFGGRMFAEEMLAGVGAAFAFEGLIFAIHRIGHNPAQLRAVIAHQKRVPERAPNHLDDVPAGAFEIALQFLDDFAIAAHRPIQALQIAINDKDQIIQIFAGGERDGAQAFRLIHLTIAQKRPDLSAFGIRHAAVVHVFHKAGLVDRHKRAEPHGDGWELPKIGHQPGMRIGAEARAIGLLAEPIHLRFGQPSFQKGAAVDAGGDMALHKDHIAAVLIRGRVPKVIEADIIEGGRAGE